MKKALLLIALFLIHITGNHTVLCQNKQFNTKDTNDNILINKNNSTESKECPHANSAADFYYGTILALSTFPKETVCTDQEEAGISSFLEERINAVLRSIPGTIRTNNKVCGNPINRRRLTAPKEGGAWHDNTTMTGTSTSLLRLGTTRKQQEQQNERFLHRSGGRRSYIYVGGGKCRFCLNDNFDKRALLSRSSSSSLTTHYENEYNSSVVKDRNLLFFTMEKPDVYPKVADISLCKKSGNLISAFSNHQNSTKWINKQDIKFIIGTRRKRSVLGLGPYMAGDLFGFQLDTKHALSTTVNKLRQYFGESNKTMVKQPVREGSIRFYFWAFDLPMSTTGMLPDNPLYVFINGVKLDFGLLIAQPGVNRTTGSNWETLTGSSFAGIKWKIERFIPHVDFAFGRQPDQRYNFEITAPLVLLAHKNQLDLDFMINLDAQAQHYAISNLITSFNVVHCEVTDLENSPFEDFKSVVESRLFHKLGIDLAHEFQSKRGHCLHDKIPVVDVHLVEKQGWQDSNPQCAQKTA